MLYTVKSIIKAQYTVKSKIKAKTPSLTYIRFLSVYYFQGLCLRSKRPIDQETHVPCVSLRHTGTYDRKHASRHLQEDNDRAFSASESRETGGHQRPDKPRYETYEPAH